MTAVCVTGIFALMVYIVHQASVVARELRLNVDEIIFVDIHIVLMLAVSCFQGNARHLSRRGAAAKASMANIEQLKIFISSIFRRFLHLDGAKLSLKLERSKYSEPELWLFEYVLRILAIVGLFWDNKRSFDAFVCLLNTKSFAEKM